MEWLRGYGNVKEGNPLGIGYGAMKMLKKGIRWGAVTGLWKYYRRESAGERLRGCENKYI